MFKLSIRVLKAQNNLRWINTEIKLIQGSLTSRFHEYLSKSSDNFEISNQLAAIHQQFSCDPKQAIRNIDAVCMRGLKNRIYVNEAFACLEYVAYHMPNQVHNLKFYAETIKRILSSDEQTCRKEFIKLCFYIGFFKKVPPGPEFMKNLLENHLDKLILEQYPFSTNDLAIVSVSSYKTSVRIENKIFHERIINEILSMSNVDEFLLVAFIKTLKYNRISSQKVLEKIKKIICESDFTYKPLVHLLPYIYEHGSSDSNKLIELICEKCINSFNNESRVKDVQKFLHSCALLNWKIDKKDLEKLEEIVLDRTENEEFNTHFDHFVNATLCLWILNYQSRRLIIKIFQDKRFYATGPYSRIKLDSRMKLLKTCVEIERPEWINQYFKIMKSFNANRRAPLYLIRNSLEKVMKGDELQEKKAIFVQQFKNLNIAGILIMNDNGTATHYEVLDEQTSLMNESRPNGIFNLKLRLLQKKNCDYKVISVL